MGLLNCWPFAGVTEETAVSADKVLAVIAGTDAMLKGAKDNLQLAAVDSLAKPIETLATAQLKLSNALRSVISEDSYNISQQQAKLTNAVNSQSLTGSASLGDAISSVDRLARSVLSPISTVSELVQKTSEQSTTPLIGPAPRIALPSAAEVKEYAPEKPINPPKDYSSISIASGIECNADAYTNRQNIEKLNEEQKSADLFGRLYTFVEGLLGGLGKAIPYAVPGVDLLIKGIGSLAESFSDDKNSVDRVSKFYGCDDPLFNSILGKTALQSSGMRLLAPELDYTLTPFRYAYKSLCPNQFPSSAAAIQSYIFNQIDEKLLRNWLAINGDCWDAFQPVIRSAKAKLTSFDLTQLLYRGILTESQHAERMRELGFLDAHNVTEAKELFKQLPPPSDLVRFMVRDVDDINIVKQFGLDDEFADKFTGKTKEWFAQQGMSEDYALRVWRAHWSIPSPGQLYEYYHRHRLSGEFGDSAKVFKDVETALKQQDILPFWVPRLLSLSFAPLEKRVVRQAFRIGSLTKEDVAKSFVEAGYSDENVEKLVAFESRQRLLSLHALPDYVAWTKYAISREELNKRLVNMGYGIEDVSARADTDVLMHYGGRPQKLFEQGVIGTNELIDALKSHGVPEPQLTNWVSESAIKRHLSGVLKDYRTGIVPREAAQNAAIVFGIPAETIVPELETIDNQRKSRLMYKCAKAILKRFKDGELDREQAITSIQRNGIPLANAIELANAAACEINATGKTISAERLCSLHSQGLLSPSEFVTRLRNSGYSDTDSIRLVSSCVLKLAEKAGKAVEKQYEKQRRELEKERRKLISARKSESRQVEEMERENQRGSKAVWLVEKKIARAAAKLAKTLGIDAAQAALIANEAWQTVIAETGHNYDVAADFVTIAASGWKPSSEETFSQFAVSAAMAASL